MSSPSFDRVEFQDITRRYGRRRALSKVSLTAQSSEIVGLFGPNGAGKSTLLAIAATLIRPTSGMVTYGDADAATLGDALRARIGLLGHDLFLYADLTARENLQFFGELYGMADVSVQVERALELARLQDRADDRVGGFSRGLRQRLAFERAVLHDPQLLCLDEPFTGLDDSATERLGERLGELRKRGTIVLMASHDFETADALVDRAVCLAAGRLHEIEPGSGSLRERYRATLRKLAS